MNEQALRDHLLWLLRGGGAHLDFDRATADLPADLRGVRPPNLPYSPWELVEHLRLCQWDILEFSRKADHVSPSFPDGYWPDSPAPPDVAAWQASLDEFRDDLQALQDMVADPQSDLFAPFPWGDGQTLLRQALLTADHNAYHLGQLIVVRRALGAWSD